MPETAIPSRNEDTGEVDDLSAGLPLMLRELESGVTEEEEIVNYAEKEEIRDRIKREIIPLLDAIRDRRTSLEHMWAQMFKIWTLEHEEQGYAGRSNVYMPAGKKVIETLVAQLVAGTFPGDETFDVKARSEENATKAVTNKAVLAYRMDTAKIRTKAEAFYRQLALTGNSPVKIHYVKDTIKTVSRGPGGEEIEKVRVRKEGPQFDCLDINCFYAFPENANSLEEASIIFEDISVPFAELVRKEKKGIYFTESVDNLRKVKRENKTRSDQNKLSAQGLSSPGDTANYTVADITEVWIDFDPDAEDADEELEPRPFLITVCGNEVLRAVDNPLWHKRPPYLMGRMGTQVGRLYGTGYAEGIRELNILLNDQTNQSMDCGTYALNPVVISNPNLILGQLQDIEPGVNWSVMDINAAVRFERPPADLINAGSILTAQTQSWINDFGGAPPVLQGGSSPGRAFRTATGIGTAQKNATMPLNEVVKLTETEVWEPMLDMFYDLDQQFAPDEMYAKFSPEQIVRATPEEVMGDWTYKWLASSQASNQALKGQQLMELLTLLSTPNIKQQLMESGKKANIAPLIKRMYEEVFGFRNVESVLENAPPPMPEPPPGPGMPGMPPMELPPGMDIPQLPEGLGDNGEFQGMRQDADAMAASMGAANMLGGLA